MTGGKPTNRYRGGNARRVDRPGTYAAKEFANDVCSAASVIKKLQQIRHSDVRSFLSTINGHKVITDNLGGIQARSKRSKLKGGQGKGATCRIKEESAPEKKAAERSV